MLVADVPPPCATSCTWPGPNATAWPSVKPAAVSGPLDPVLLDEAAFGDRERPGRAAVVMPVGVLAALPGQQPDVTGVGSVQRQVPAHVRVAHDQVSPQVAAGRQRGRDRPQLARRQPSGSAGARPLRAVRISCCRAGLTPQPGLRPPPVAARLPNPRLVASGRDRHKTSSWLWPLCIRTRDGHDNSSSRCWPGRRRLLTGLASVFQDFTVL